MSNKKYASLQTLQTFLANLKNTFSELSHKHTLSDITDYVVDAELSENSTNPVQNKVINDELDAIATAMNALDLVVSNKANANHDHNDIYYTKEELDEVIQNNSSQMDFVSYNKQDLTGEQKSQARKNIGVSEMIADTLIAMDLISSVVEDEGGSLAEEDGVLLVVRNDELFLPKVTTENNGNVLTVVDGAWVPGEVEIPEVNYPVTSVNGMTGDVVLNEFETKTDASAKLEEAKQYTDSAVANLVNSAPETLDTIGELAAAFEENEDMVAALDDAITNKADKSELFSGSWNDLTDKPTEEDALLVAMETGLIEAVPTASGEILKDKNNTVITL